MKTEKDEICCPKFDPNPWEDQLIEWDKKQFIKGTVRTFIYLPLNFGKVMTRLDEQITQATAQSSDCMCLSDHTSKWKMNIYLAVNKPILGCKNTTISGEFYSKVYEGDFKNTDKWMKESEKAAEQKGYDIQKWYMWYTTCPKCAKKYGKNYVVILGQLR
jgi:hypothetical protein